MRGLFSAWRREFASFVRSDDPIRLTNRWALISCSCWDAVVWLDTGGISGTCPHGVVRISEKARGRFNANLKLFCNIGQVFIHLGRSMSTVETTMARKDLIARNSSCVWECQWLRWDTVLNLWVDLRRLWDGWINRDKKKKLDNVDDGRGASTSSGWPWLLWLSYSCPWWMISW